MKERGGVVVVGERGGGGEVMEGGRERLRDGRREWEEGEAERGREGKRLCGREDICMQQTVVLLDKLFTQCVDPWDAC